MIFIVSASGAPCLVFRELTSGTGVLFGITNGSAFVPGAIDSKVSIVDVAVLEVGGSTATDVCGVCQHVEGYVSM